MRRYRITIGDKVFEVEIVAVRGDQARVLVNGRPYEAKFSPTGAPASPRGPAAPAAAPPPPPPKTAPAPRPLEAAVPAGAAGAVVAPMPGSILEVLVKVGDPVRPGDTVVKLEAMKMENDVKASLAGVVSEVRVSKGSNVAKGEVLLVISPS
jgi:biotin carboxyl carrier protein